MLLSKFMTNGDIVSLKLVNGDELIARLESETENEIKINRPLAITVAQSGLGMIPWMFLGGSDNVTLQRGHVLTMMISKKDAADQYIQGTTGIALR